MKPRPQAAAKPQARRSARTPSASEPGTAATRSPGSKATTRQRRLSTDVNANANASPADDAEGLPLQQALRICFERILPDALDPERHVRREVRNQLIRATGRTLDANEVSSQSRMAVVLTKRWEPGQTLRCRFLGGTATMQGKVKRLCQEWQAHADVRFDFVDSGPAEIRIAFNPGEGSWSAVGRDALNTAYFPQHQPTMNFGWVSDHSNAAEDRAVILHEFGHALGCIHEHQTPTFERKWNRTAVLNYFRGPPNYWTDAEIEFNVLKKYSRRGIRATEYDPNSIMLYTFDAALFADGKGPTNSNLDLSNRDQEMIASMYPAPAPPPRRG